MSYLHVNIQNIPVTKFAYLSSTVQCTLTYISNLSYNDDTVHYQPNKKYINYSYIKSKYENNLFNRIRHVSLFSLLDYERKSLHATAAVQSQLGCPVIIHPGRHGDAPEEIIRILQEAGGDATKTIMSHLDRKSDLYPTSSGAGYA